MRWVDVMEAVRAALLGDATLAAISGFRVYPTGEYTSQQVPGIGWMIFSDLLEENTNPVRVQFDIWARGLDQMVTIERRMFEVLHRNMPRELEGVLMRTERIDARGHADPEPGVTHRSTDYLFEPAREG